MAVAAGVAEAERRAARSARDWPRTDRLMPWLTALVVATVLVVPIDSETLPVPIPFDARPDRVLLVACFGLWALILAVQAPDGPPGTRYRFGAIEVLLLLFTVVATLSIARNVTQLGIDDEASTAVKKLVLLLSYLAFYLLVVGTVRASEVPAFVRLIVVLGAVAAVGTIIEYATGRNLFFTVATWVAPPGTSFSSSATLTVSGGRPDVTGPARHGLAISTMLAMILPLALVGAVFADSGRDRVLYRLAAVLLFVGCLTTFRRSGVILPFIASSAVIFGGGRRMFPLAAVFVVLLVVTPIVAPGAVAEITSQFSTSNASTQESVEGRTADYPAVIPDVAAEAVTGRGFGSYIARRYRFIDNEYILLAIETGLVGIASYLALLVVSAGMALRTGLRRAGPASWIGLAVFGSVLAFMAANAFFDALSFPQAPYAFALVVALASIARQAEDGGGALGL
jgi:O-antigen ligase/polysaccharide polymerase Wzy-like membrane protein